MLAPPHQGGLPAPTAAAQVKVIMWQPFHDLFSEEVVAGLLSNGSLGIRYYCDIGVKKRDSSSSWESPQGGEGVPLCGRRQRSAFLMALPWGPLGGGQGLLDTELVSLEHVQGPGKLWVLCLGTDGLRLYEASGLATRPGPIKWRQFLLPGLVCRLRRRLHCWAWEQLRVFHPRLLAGLL